MKLDEMAEYMRDGDAMNKGLFENGVSFLSDKERAEILQKTDGPLVISARGDANKIIKQCSTDIESRLAECSYPGCKAIADPVIQVLNKFHEALEKGSWKGVADADREHLINLHDLLIIKSVARRDTEKALNTMNEIVEAERQRQIAMGIEPDQVSPDDVPTQKSGMMKWLLIGAAVVVVLVLLGLAIWFFTKASERLEQPADQFQRLYIDRILNQ